MPRCSLFDSARDYDASLEVLVEAVDNYPTRLLAYRVMPNHLYLVV